MQARRLRAVTFIALATLAGCRHDFTASDRRAVEELLAHQQDAWNRGDLPSYMGAYARTPELVFTSGSKIRRGWEATLAAYQQRYGGDRAGMGRLVFEMLGVQPVGSG